MSGLLRFKLKLSIAGLLLLISFSVASAADQCTEYYGNGKNHFSLATGSPGELGLLKVLAEEFSRQNDTTMCWQKAGSGRSIKLLKEKKVDMVMVHAPAAEKQAIAEGWAIKRSLIGSNEFYLVGPASDPAKVSSAGSVAEAFTRIANNKALFYSRGDNSGTHKKELAIWQKAAIKPDGKWYQVTKTFMMATLKMANENGGYFMTDSSTWVAARKEMGHLSILYRGDPFMINTYHSLCQPAGSTAGQAYAAKFIDFVSSDSGQQIIRDYGRDVHGEGLYNDAVYAKQYDH